MSRNVGIGKVYTTRIQKPHFSGLGVYDPKKVFFTDDENGKVIIDDVRSTITRTFHPGPYKDYIMLGGEKYHWVEWEGLLIIDRDLKWDVGAYAINPNAPESFGYYYENTDANIAAIEAALAEAGYSDWRVPTAEDWTVLINEPDITLPTAEKWERDRGITKLLSDKYTSVFPYHADLNKSRIGLNPCRIATSTAAQFDRANYLENNASNHNVVFRYIEGYTVVTANYGASAGACVRLVKNARPQDYVIIGGKSYRTVKIGSQTWLAENLEYLDENIVLGNGDVSSTVAQANWYNNDQSTSYGLLYNYTAVKYIEDNKATICPGWHVPTEAELKVIADLGYTAVRDDTWNNYPGDNSSGFTLKAAGQFTGSFSNKGLSTGLLSITTAGDLVRRLNSVNLINEMSSTTKTGQLSLRLIKDS